MSALFLIAAIICYVFVGFAGNAPEWLGWLGHAFFAASFLVTQVPQLIRRD